MPFYSFVGIGIYTSAFTPTPGGEAYLARSFDQTDEPTIDNCGYLLTSRLQILVGAMPRS